MELQTLFNIGGGFATAILTWLLNGYRQEMQAQRNRVHELASKIQTVEISQAKSETSLGHINKELSEIKSMLATISDRLNNVSHK